jgi:hypothetical protein
MHLTLAAPPERELAIFVYVRVITTFFIGFLRRLPHCHFLSVGMVGKVGRRLPCLPRRSC